MKTLTELHEEMRSTMSGNDLGYPHDISPTNIDDIIWYGKARGLKSLAVLPTQLEHIWQFLAANCSKSDTEMRRLYFVEGKCPKILGVNIKILPYTYTDLK